jgi:hypothetical protein
LKTVIISTNCSVSSLGEQGFLSSDHVLSVSITTSLFAKSSSRIGLVNAKGGLYGTSIIQSFFHIPKFRAIVRGLPADVSQIAITLKQLFERMRTAHQPCNCLDFLNSFPWDSDRKALDPTPQQFVDRLLESLLAGPDLTQAIDDLFLGRGLNEDSVFRSLTLPIAGCSDLTESFRQYVEANSTFICFPRVLLLFFDRQSPPAAKGTAKLTFPPVLNLDEFLSQADARVSSVYEIFGVVSHRSAGQTTAYSTVLRTSPAHDWFKFFDSQVSGLPRTMDAYFCDTPIAPADMVTYIQRNHIGAVFAEADPVAEQPPVGIASSGDRGPVHSFFVITDGLLRDCSLCEHFEMPPVTAGDDMPEQISVSGDCASLYHRFAHTETICTIAPFAVLPRSGTLEPYFNSSWIYPCPRRLSPECIIVFVYAYEQVPVAPLRFCAACLCPKQSQVGACRFARDKSRKPLKAWQLSLGRLVALNPSSRVKSCGLVDGAQVFVEGSPYPCFTQLVAPLPKSYLGSQPAPIYCRDYFRRVTNQVTCDVRFRRDSCDRLKFPRDLTIGALVHWLCHLFSVPDSDADLMHVYCGSEMTPLESLHSVWDKSVLEMYRLERISPLIVCKSLRVLVTYSPNGMTASAVTMLLLPLEATVGDLINQVRGNLLTDRVRVLKTTLSGRIQRIVQQTESLAAVQNVLRLDSLPPEDFYSQGLIPVNFFCGDSKPCLAFIHRVLSRRSVAVTKRAIQGTISGSQMSPAFRECRWELRPASGKRTLLRDEDDFSSLWDPAQAQTLEVSALPVSPDGQPA